MLEGLTIRCAFRLFPLGGTGTLSATQNLHSWVTASGTRGYQQVGEEEECQVPKTNRLLQRSIRCTQINPELSLSSQGGSREHPHKLNLYEAKVGYELLVQYHDGTVPQEDKNREGGRGSSTGRSAFS
jgi:hypothetical protein